MIEVIEVIEVIGMEKLTLLIAKVKGKVSEETSRQRMERNGSCDVANSYEKRWRKAHEKASHSLYKV